jgi:hypothetical protein
MARRRRSRPRAAEPTCSGVLYSNRRRQGSQVWVKCAI